MSPETPVRVLHTADLQLGKPFVGIPGDQGAELRLRRLGALDRIADVARDREVDLVLVAGDLFDANTVGDRIVHRALERIGAISVPVVVLPGNHDYCGGPDSVYRRGSFRRDRPENLVLADEPVPVPLLGGRAVVLPAPLTRRHETGDVTTHITEEFGREEAPGAVRIGMAHGSVLDFGEGADASNSVDPALAQEAALDYLALGDWHGAKEMNPRAWYSGTPEPTAFGEKNPGYVLIVELPGPGSTPTVERVQVASTRWEKRSANLLSADDIRELLEWFEDLGRPEDVLVRLELSGSLTLEEKAKLERLLEVMETKLLHLRRRGPGIAPRLDEDEIDEIATEGYVRSAVEELRDLANGSTEDAQTAARSLELLYRMQSQEVGA